MFELRDSSESDPHEPPARSRAKEARILLHLLLLPLLLLLPVISTGCVSLRRHPVAANVVRARQLSHQGIDAMQQGKWEEAEILFAQAIEHCAADERAHHRYAEALWHRGAWQEAMEHMESAVSLSGEDAALLVQLGEMYLARGQFHSAGAQAERAIQRKRQSAGAWKLRGDVLRRQGDWEEAMLSYHRALSIEPHQPEAQLALSELYLQQQRPRRALSTLESLASHSTTGEIPQQVLLMQGVALKQLERYQDAAGVLAQAAEQHLTGEVLFQLAEAQWLAGDAASAQVAVQGALQRLPQDQRAEALLAAIRQRLPLQQASRR